MIFYWRNFSQIIVYWLELKTLCFNASSGAVCHSSPSPPLVMEDGRCRQRHDGELHAGPETPGLLQLRRSGETWGGSDFIALFKIWISFKHEVIINTPCPAHTAEGVASPWQHMQPEEEESAGGATGSWDQWEAAEHHQPAGLLCLGERQTFFSVGSTLKRWASLLPHNKEALGSRPRDFLCGVQMSSYSLVSSHSVKQICG